MATEFPNVNFAIGTGYKLAENVGVYDVKLEQGGYLMGLIAGSLTESNLVGAVGGVDVSEIHRGHVAFLLGAQKVNTDVKVLNTFVGDFNDLAGAKEVGKTVAARAIEKGIKQVVFDRGGYLYHGRVKAIAEAARESGLKF